MTEKNAALFEEYKAREPSKFLFFAASYGLDGKKFAEVQGRLTEDGGTEDDKIIQEASITGDRKTLQADSFIPATMAVIYLLIFFISSPLADISHSQST